MRTTRLLRIEVNEMGKINLEDPSQKQKTEVQILAERIVDECRKQGFKVGQFELLIEQLSFVLSERVYRFKFDLF